MPNTPGTSARKVIDPALSGEDKDRVTTPANPVLSSTFDPFEGIEAGRTVPVAPAP